GREPHLRVLAVDGDDLEERALAVGLGKAAPASNQLALVRGGGLLVEDRVHGRGAGRKLEGRDRPVLGPDRDVAVADRGAINAARAAFGVAVMGVFDLRRGTPDVDDLDLDGT